MRSAFLRWSIKFYLADHPDWVVNSRWFGAIVETAADLCDIGCANDVFGIDNLVEMAHIM